MSKDILHYLSPGDAGIIEHYAVDLQPLVERNPRLRDIDLIIEGGVGTRRNMVHMMRRIFPQALYIGMDLSEIAGATRPWLRGSIDENALQRIISANEYPSFGMEGAMVKANCWDMDLIVDIMHKTNRTTPLFATYLALEPLREWRDLNIDERKHSDDEVVTAEKLVSMDIPFIAQIHVPTDRELERKAQQAGWVTDKFDIGLMLLKAS